jgi:hypothetical protein
MALERNDRIGWRGRTFGFLVLSRLLPHRLSTGRCLAVATAFFDLAVVYDGCSIAEGRLTVDAIARVLRILADEEKAKVIARNEAYYDAEVNPLYLPNARVVVQRPNSAPTIAVAPRNWQGQPGDIVVIKGADRDPDPRCHFVLPMIQGSVSLS